MKFATIQSDFSAGELSPSMVGKNDLDVYKNGLGTLENFIINEDGSISRRGGLLIVNSVNRGTSTKIKMIPWTRGLNTRCIVLLTKDSDTTGSLSVAIYVLSKSYVGNGI